MMSSRNTKSITTSIMVQGTLSLSTKVALRGVRIDEIKIMLRLEFNLHDQE